MAASNFWSVNLDDSRDLDLTELVAGTLKLQLSTQIFSLYPYVEWVVNASVSYIELGVFNIGQGLTFTFHDDRIGKQVAYTFYISSVNYSEVSPDASIPVTLNIRLSTAYEFKDVIGAKGYYGNVADILKQIFNEELSISGALSSVKLIKGVDYPMKRFRTYETTKEFIEKKLADSFRGEEETLTYIYTDLTGKLTAMHVLAAEDELDTFYCYHQGYHNTIKLAELEKDSKVSANVSRFEGMNVYINENHRMWQVANAGISMMYRTNTPKILNDLPVFRMFPPMNRNVKEMLPINSRKSKEYSQLTEIFLMDDENDYSKEYTALSYRRNVDLLDGLKIVLSTDLNLSMKAGHIMKLYPPSLKFSTPYVASLFEGNWLMTEVSHVFKTVNGRTYITLQATSLPQRNTMELDSRFYRQQ